jgi:hypothetical protein
MRKIRWKTIVFPVGLALLALGTIAYYAPAAQPSNTQSQTPTTPSVTNQTTAVQVISVAPGSIGYEVVMRNVSNKNINGYTVGYGLGASVTSDLTSTYKPIISPGEEFKLELPITTSITIQSIVFDDNTIDGNAEVASQLQDRRKGIKKQLQTIVNLLNSEGPNADVEQLKAEIEKLSEDAPGFEGAGMHNAKEDALLVLKKLDKNNKSTGLLKFIEESNKRMSRLREN